MFCSECGADSGEDAQFCPACGAALGAVARAKQEAPTRWWRSRRALVGLLAVVALGAIGAVAVSLVLGDAPEDHAVEMVPADVTFYATAYLDPSLGQKRATQDLLDRASDAGAGDGKAESLEDAVGALVTASSEIDYGQDVKPTNGNQMAVYIRAGAGPTVLLSTGDPDASRRAMRRMLEREFPSGSYRLLRDSYRGRPYEHVVYREFDDAPSGSAAYTVIGDFVVAGSEEDVRASIDAARGGSLADSEDFSDARESVDDDVLAFAYFDAGPLERAARDERYPDSDEVRTLQLLAGLGPVAATVTAADGTVELEMAARSASGQAAALQNPSELLSTLPAEAIAAISLGDLGGPLRALLDRGGVWEGDLREVVGELAELDVDSDVAPWLGGLAAYIAGEDSEDARGALVAETRSREDSDGMLDRIESYYAGYGYDYDEDVYGSDDGLGFDVFTWDTVLHVRGDEDRVIAGAGANEFSADRALDAEGGFGETSLYRRASGLLGGYEPFLALDAPPLQRLLEQATEAEYDDDYQENVREWLTTISTLAGGVRREGGQIRLRLAAELR